MANKLTKNGKVRGRKPKGADSLILPMPPEPRGGMETIDIVRAILAETRKNYKGEVDTAGLSGVEFEKKAAAVARKRQRDIKKIRSS